MDHTSTELKLLLPGLESAAAALLENSSSSSLLAENRLSWSEEASLPWEVSLQHALGIVAGDTDIPMARALYSVEVIGEDPANASADESMPVVCADPIHLKADRDTASLVPGSALAIDSSDAAALISSLNEFVRDDGLEFVLHNACNWILKGVVGDDLAAFPPHYLAERSISPYLSDSTGNVKWRRWQTEWQMLLHSHPVNHSRMAAGKLPINSLWLWGGSALPDACSMSALVYADDDNAIALSRGFDVPTKPLAELNHLSNELSNEPSVDRFVILDTRLLDAWMARDADQLAESLRAINHELIPILVDALDKRQLSTLVIVTEDGHRATLQATVGWLSRLTRMLSAR